MQSLQYARDAVAIQRRGAPHRAAVRCRAYTRVPVSNRRCLLIGTFSGLLWSFNSASAQEKVQQSAPPTLAAPSSAAAATPQPQQQQQQVVPPSDLPGSSRAPDIPLQPASTAQPSDRQVPTTIIEQSSSSGTPSAAPHSESTPQSPAALQPPRATSEKYGSAVEFTLEEKAKKEDEEGKRQARKRKKGRLRELEEIRAELAEKELILLQKEQELLDKDQTLLVLKEELELERKLRALLTKEKERAEEEAALAMGLCTGGAMLP